MESTGRACATDLLMRTAGAGCPPLPGTPADPGWPQINPDITQEPPFTFVLNIIPGYFSPTDNDLIDFNTRSSLEREGRLPRPLDSKM